MTGALEIGRQISDRESQPEVCHISESRTQGHFDATHATHKPHLAAGVQLSAPFSGSALIPPLVGLGSVPFHAIERRAKSGSRLSQLFAFDGEILCAAVSLFLLSQ